MAHDLATDIRNPGLQHSHRLVQGCAWLCSVLDLQPTQTINFIPTQPTQTHRRNPTSCLKAFSIQDPAGAVPDLPLNA